MIDLVLAVVALVICDSRSGHGCRKTACLSHAPHRHVAAITPAGQSQAMLVNRGLFDRLVHAGHNVAPVAVTKVLNVGAGKLFALAKAAAWVRHKNKITSTGQSYTETVRPRPRRADHGAGATVYLHNHRIFFRRIEVARIQQPALKIEALVRPVNALRFSPGRFKFGIGGSDLLPVADRSCPHLRWMGQRLAHHGRHLMVRRHRHCRAPSIRADLIVGLEQCIDFSAGQINRGQAAAAIDLFTEEDAVSVRSPRQPTGRGLHAWGNVPRLSSFGRDDENISADGRFVAHQTLDKRHGLAIGRPGRVGNLKRCFMDGFHLAARGLERVNLRNVPVVVAIAMGRGGHKTFAVGRPVVFINVHVRR